MGGRAYLNIYVDTNVLINYCTGQQSDVKALNYLFQKRTKDRLFTSTLAIVQTITNLQTKKATRKAFSKSETISAIKYILSHFSIISLDSKDILEGFVDGGEDIEDNIHFVLSKKFSCDVIVTNNCKDFTGFPDVMIMAPKVSALARHIW